MKSLLEDIGLVCCLLENNCIPSCTTVLAALSTLQRHCRCSGGVTGPELPPGLEILSGGENTLRIFPPPRASVLGQKLLSQGVGAPPSSSMVYNYGR